MYYLIKLLWVRNPAQLHHLAQDQDCIWQSSEGLLSQSWKVHLQYGSHGWEGQVNLWQEALPTGLLRHPQKVTAGFSQWTTQSGQKGSLGVFVTQDLRSFFIDIFTMPVGCQIRPLHYGITLYAQFSSNDSDPSRKPGTKANRAPPWNWLPLLAKVEPKSSWMKPDNYAEEKYKTVEEDD